MKALAVIRDLYGIRFPVKIDQYLINLIKKCIIASELIITGFFKMSISKNLKRFGIIYKRNVMGVLNALLSLPMLYLFPYTTVPMFYLLPLTLTLGAGIKSIIDFATRKFLDSQSIENAKNTLHEISIETSELNKLFKEILKSHPQSHSSKKVQADLICDRKSFEISINQHIQNLISAKQNELDKKQTEGLHHGAKAVGSVLSEQEKIEVKNEFIASEDYQKLLEEFKQKIKSRVYIYISAKHNFGKSTHNKICEALGGINLAKSTSESEEKVPTYNSFFKPFVSSSKPVKKEQRQSLDSSTTFVDLSTSTL
jgi:hypothetical protein